MGAGIAQVSAAAGFRTIVLEVNDAALAKGLGRIDKFLEGGVAKGKMTADDKAAILGRLSGTTSYADLAPSWAEITAHARSGDVPEIDANETANL